jgi:hypothetical protein
MASVYEKLCQTVHREMLRYKPALQKVAAEGIEDEDDEQRFLGQTIIKSFPLPIGVELRRLFSITLRKPDKQQLEQLFITIEQSLQLIAYIMVSQLWNEKKLNRIIIPESFSKIFRQKIYLRNTENYKWIIQTITNFFDDRSVEFFVPEIKESMNEDFLNSFEYSIPGRNPEGHYIINSDPAEVERQCIDIGEKLTLLLQHLAFLVNYKLVSVQHIQVVKPKYQQPKYNHILKLLTCTDSDFNSFEQQNSICADSHSVLLMKSQLPLTENLNLSPLIIDTASFLGDGPATGNLKKDIFLFDGSHDSHLNYKGCRVTEKCDLSSMPDYPMLLSQFRDMMETIVGVEK